MVSQAHPEYWQKRSGDFILCREFAGRSVIGLHAQRIDQRRVFHCLDHFIVEPRAAIKDQIAGRGVVRKSLAQLLNNPLACRMLGYIAVKNAPPVMRNDEKSSKTPLSNLE
jgi:hypothetical protein